MNLEKFDRHVPRKPRPLGRGASITIADCGVCLPARVPTEGGAGRQTHNPELFVGEQCRSMKSYNPGSDREILHPVSLTSEFLRRGKGNTVLFQIFYIPS